MFKIKNNTKILLILGIMLVAIFIFNMNVSNATEIDENYVKNLKLTSPKYYEVSLDFLPYNDESEDTWNNVYEKYKKMIEDYYTKQINIDSITVTADLGEGGTDGGLNLVAATQLSIYLNGTLCDTKSWEGGDLTVPVINVPSTVEDSKLNDYLKEIITKANKSFGKNITKIEKGTKNKSNDYGIDFDIPNGYTVYSNYGATSYVIINGIDNIEEKTNSTTTLKDNATNVRLEANDGIVPSNTVLEVQPITEGKLFENVKKVLSSVNKFKVFDITLKSDSVKIQPNGKVKISIPIPENFDTSKLMVYRIETNGQKIAYKVSIITIEGIKYAQFETDHFSTYVLAEVEANEKDNTPKTGVEINIMPYILGIVTIIGVAFIIKRR